MQDEMKCKCKVAMWSTCV